MPKKILTKREADIIKLKVSGLGDKAIAESLAISYWTVRTHISKIKDKLKCTNLYQAVNLLKRVD